MATLIAIKKNGESCIAIDSWSMRDPWMSPSICLNDPCIIKVGDALIGLNSSVAFQQAFETTLHNLGPRGILTTFATRQEVFDFFLKVHEALRNQYFMNVSYQPTQEFEWTPMNAIVVTRDSLFRVDSSRAVYEFSKYWAFGSGEAFALGSLHALYDQIEKPTELAERALSAVKEFDPGSQGQILIQSLKKPILSMATDAAPSTDRRKREPKNRSLRLTDISRDRKK